MAYLRCDECGSSTTHQGSWSTPIKILCEKCSKKNDDNKDIKDIKVDKNIDKNY